jgi:hypothetical protein
MLRRISRHISGNVVGYVALFAALGGTSYAAVRLTPGSVTARALARGSVTHTKLAAKSITSGDIRDGTIKQGDLAPAMAKALGHAGATGSAGSSGSRGGSGASGSTGKAGPAGPAGPSGANGDASVVARARGTGSVSAPHGASTNVPIGSATWTQATGEMDLITGSVTLAIPSSCTGSFGNSLIISVDGTPATFAVAPSSPASTTVTMPVNVTSVMEPSASASHTLTASLGNSCTKGGEDYTVNDVKLDVVKFT